MVARQEWWPINPYIDRHGYGAAYEGFNEACLAMDIVWRERIQAVLREATDLRELERMVVALLGERDD